MGTPSSAAAGTARWASGEAGHSPDGAGEGGPGELQGEGGWGQTFAICEAARLRGCAGSSAGEEGRKPSDSERPHPQDAPRGGAPEHQQLPARWPAWGGGGPAIPPNAESAVLGLRWGLTKGSLASPRPLCLLGLHFQHQISQSLWGLQYPGCPPLLVCPPSLPLCWAVGLPPLSSAPSTSACVYRGLGAARGPGV